MSNKEVPTQPTDLPWPCTCGRTSADGCDQCSEADAAIAARAKADYWRDHPIKQAGEWGRAIFETAKASSDDPNFGDAWRNYSTIAGIAAMVDHDRALIRVAFVAGWRARGIV
jgi:hypothetical protein